MDAFLTGHLTGVSRTYAILVPLLPDGLSDAVGIAYLVMRIVDTVEDAPDVDPESRRMLLHALDTALDGDPAAIALISEPRGERPEERSLMASAPEVFRRLSALRPEFRLAITACARTMIRGVETLLDRAAARAQTYPAIATPDELREYCYYVAGTVGEMLCAMFAAHLSRPALMQLNGLAVELGIGLQLVNILKDVAADAVHGRRYLPHADHGHRASAGVLTRTVLASAQSSLAAGVEFVLSLPAAARGVRRFCGLPIAWGALTLASDAGRQAEKISRGVLYWTMQRFDALVADDEALRGWLLGLLAGREGPPRSLVAGEPSSAQA